MGPILIFDKSTLQSLSVDEAVWLHNFYSANITPLFFVETLADLEKEVKAGRRAEDVVGNLALKTAPLGAKLNMYHWNLCAAELLGSKVEMDGRIVISDAQAVITANGSGVLFRPSPEEDAMQRWQRGEFLEVERRFARIWREALAGLDLGRSKLSRSGHPKPKTLDEARRIAADSISHPGWRYRTLEAALDIFGISPELRPDVITRWKSAGGPPISEFVPYVTHVLTVDTFLGICLQAGLISAERPSNRVDIAYLYYLPFCMVFTSNDKLHRSTVPLFLRSDQRFILGSELKADMAKLDAHYSQLPEEIKQRGVMSFAHFPPTEGEFLTTRVWDELMSPNWRDSATRPPLSEEQHAALLELVKKFSSGSTPASGSKVDISSLGGLVVESRVPTRLGKWRLLPPEVERNEPSSSR